MAGMDAYVTRLYRKEEEFLEDFYETVDALLPLLPGRWQPNFRCNDLECWKRQLQLRAGQLDALTFDEAVIFHDKGQFASLQLRLRSSARLLVVRVRWVPDMVIEVLLDQALDVVA
jgi:hypothetical protein